MKRIVPEYEIIICNGLCHFYDDYGDFLHCSLSNEEFQHKDKSYTGFPEFCRLKIAEPIGAFPVLLKDIDTERLHIDISISKPEYYKYKYMMYILGNQALNDWLTDKFKVPGEDIKNFKWSNDPSEHILRIYMGNDDTLNRTSKTLNRLILNYQEMY
jgi:hypothetical protein